jgi:aminopeptidase-like protein
LSALFDELFPIMRSITGPGLRASFEILGRFLPLTVETVASGEAVFDWIAPPEWHFRGARLVGPDGATVVDAADSTLHVLNYSEAVDRTLTLDELQPHLYSLEALPEAVPYVTSYYRRHWGFCLSHRQRQELRPGRYHAVIEAEFRPGGVPFATAQLEGEGPEELLLSSYLCHPSLANNELSGPLVLLGLYDRLSRWPRRRYGYRFLLNPETIGSLCYLHRHGQRQQQTLIGGLVLTCLGGPSPSLSYKLSRRGDGILDRVMLGLADGRLPGVGLPVDIRPFDPRGGSDERQYCSPGFNWPVGQVARTVYGAYDGYHNSLDDKAFMGIDRLVETIDALEQALRLVELACPYRNLSPFGEPQLGRRNLYPTINSADTWGRSNDAVSDHREFLNRILVVLNYSDGRLPMLDIAARHGFDLGALEPVIAVLEREGLLRISPETCRGPETRR